MLWFSGLTMLSNLLTSNDDVVVLNTTGYTIPVSKACGHLKLFPLNNDSEQDLVKNLRTSRSSCRSKGAIP